jgi:hypothetical protein
LSGASIAVELAPAEAEAVAAQAQKLAAQMPSADGRARYEALSTAAANGVISDELVPSLESLLELVLRRRPLTEPVLSGVYARTPRGQELASASREVNSALRSLRGQALQTVHLSSAPGRYGLTIETERVRLSLVLDEAGPRVESAEIG